MKKLLLILLMSLFLVGCTQIKDLSVDEIVNKVVSSKNNLSNEYRTGYKYYAPRGLRIDDNKEYNEILSDAKYKYYLYIDAVSYYNKIKFTFEEDNEAYYSKTLEYNNKQGYLEIKMYSDNKYLIEMMYNYAKIEVIVDKEDIKVAVLNSITILSSIKYNEDIINNLMGENILEFSEVEVDIFKTKEIDSDYLNYPDYNEEEYYGGEDVNPNSDSELLE